MKNKKCYLLCVPFLLSICFTEQADAQTLTVTPTGPVDSYINFQDLTASPSGAVAYEWFERSHYQFCIGPAPTGVDQGPVNWAPPGGVWFCVATWSNGSTSVSNDVLVRELEYPAFFGLFTDNLNPVCSTVGKNIYVNPHKPNNFNCTGMFWDSYQWQFNGVNIPSANSYYYHAIEAGYYSCIVSNTLGSRSTDSIYAEIDPVIPPSTVITLDTLCGFLSVPDFTGTDYQWYRDGNPITGAVDHGYYYSCNYKYKCRLTNACGTYYTPELEINNCPFADVVSITASGPLSFCPGGSVVLTAVAGSNKTYQWYAVFGAISGATNQTYTVQSGGGDFYSVVITNTNGCTMAASVYINSNSPGAFISPSGSLNFCTGGSVTLNANTGTGYSYQWKLNNINISGATSSSYIASASGNYTVQVTASCGTATSQSVIVNANAAPAYISPSGNIYFCNGDSVILHAQTGAGFSFQWRKGLTPIAGATTADYIANTSGTYTVVVNSACGSTYSNAAFVTVLTAPSNSNISVIGSDQLCTGGSAVLAATFTPLYPSPPSYQWKRNGNNISGANSSAFRVTQGGNYKVEISNQCGSSMSPVQVMNVYSNLPATIIPSGSTTFCNGDSVILSANSGIGFIYQWKKNGANIPGALSQNYAAKSSGSYTVRVSNPYGCSAVSLPVSATVNSNPSAVITPSGSVVLCSGESVTLSVPYGTNKTYQWKKGGANIPGATLSSYTAANGGTYKVTVINTVTGCSTTTTTGTVVTVNPVPSATITPQGPTTFCAGGSVVLSANSGTGLTWQWKKGGANISGATLINYTASIAGVYKVKVTNSSGCSKLSTGVTVTVPCREDENASIDNEENIFDVNVFPNPSNGDFNCEIRNPGTEKISIQIFDMIGNLILSETRFNPQFVIHMPESAPGIYSAKIICGENPDGSGQVKKVLKLIKTR